MIKVLYLLNYAGKAGTEKYVQSLAEKLNNKIKAYMAYNDGNLLVDTMESLGIETCRIRLRHPFDLKAAWQVARFCREHGINLIHTHYLRENYIAILSRLFNPGVRVLWTNHFILENNIVIRVFNRIFTVFQSGIIAVCTKGREVLIKNGNSARKTHLIFNGVDPDYWGAPEASTIRQELKIGEEAFVILCAARFVDIKGHAFLVEALFKLKGMTDKPFRCILAGDGPLLEDVKRQVKSLELEENVIFTGFRNDIKNLCGGSDISVNASQTEALSVAILESLAAGLPVIATDVGGTSDIINDENACGILVKYADSDELSKALRILMEDAQMLRRFSENALKTVRSKFSVDIMAAETYNLYMYCCRRWRGLVDR